MPTSLSLVLLAFVLPGPRAAVAQRAVIVSGDGRDHGALEAAASERVRAATGLSTRRLDLTLTDLALAAGCVEEPTSAPCVASVARAAEATTVVVERVDERGQLTLDLYAVTGERTDGLTVAGAEPVAPPTTTASAPAARRERSRTASARPDPRFDPLRVPNVLYESALLASVGAFVAGLVGLEAQLGLDAMGSAEQRWERDRLRELAERRDVALAVAAGFGLAGAGLALAGLALDLGEDGRLGVAASPTEAHLELRGRF